MSSSERLHARSESVGSSSVNFQNYAIPVSDSVLATLDNISSSDEEDDDDDDDVEETGQSESSKDGLVQDAGSSFDELLNDETLDNIINSSTTNIFDANDNALNNEPMIFDISRYIFTSLKQSLESADFSESLSIQTKTSAGINSKTLELKQLIDSTSSRLLQLQERFKRGDQVAKRIKRNLETSKENIALLNNRLRTDYPIEFSQAREKILERQDSDEN